MSYSKHEYMPYPSTSEYSGTCKHCGIRESEHHLTPDERLEKVLAKEAELTAEALAAREHYFAEKGQGEAQIQIQWSHTPPEMTPQRPEPMDEMTVAFRATELVNSLWPASPTYLDYDDRGAELWRCCFCHEPPVDDHAPDCPWKLLVEAVKAL